MEPSVQVPPFAKHSALVLEPGLCVETPMHINIPTMARQISSSIRVKLLGWRWCRCGI